VFLLAAAAGILAVVWHAFSHANNSSTVQIGATEITVEVAATQSLQWLGLSQRAKLPANSGMVFVFCPPRSMRFWMLNTQVPLDMLFICDHEIKKVCADAQPFAGRPADAPRYGDIRVSEVIEVNAGFAKQHNIKEGDKVRFALSYEPYLLNFVESLGIRLAQHLFGGSSSR